MHPPVFFYIKLTKPNIFLDTLIQQIYFFDDENKRFLGGLVDSDTKGPLTATPRATCMHVEYWNRGVVVISVVVKQESCCKMQNNRVQHGDVPDSIHRFSWTIANITPKISYFFYQTIILLDLSIQKTINLILKKISLVLDRDFVSEMEWILLGHFGVLCGDTY